MTRTMDGEKTRARVRKVKRGDVAVISAILWRTTASLITMVMLLWVLRCGVKLAMEPWRYAVYAAQAFHVGVAILLLGFLFLILGFSILVDLFLNLSELLQGQNGTHQGKERGTISKAIAKAFVTVITVLVLLWATYTGFRLSTESNRDNKLYILTFSIGVTTTIFGLIYFMFGLGIILELAVDFSRCLHQKE